MQRVILVIGTLVLSTAAAAGCMSPQEAAAREAAYEASLTPQESLPAEDVGPAEPAEPPVVPMRTLAGANCSREPWNHVAFEWMHAGRARASTHETFQIPMDAIRVVVELRAPRMTAGSWSMSIDGPGAMVFHSEKTQVRGDGVVIEALERGKAWSEETGWAGTYAMAWDSTGLLRGFSVRVVAELCG